MAKFANATVTLRWTGVYEGSDTVCEVSVLDAKGHTKVLSVWGQPYINAPAGLIAFASCADDGCDAVIVVADISRGVLLKGALPVSAQQHYFKLAWQLPGRTLSVLDEGPAADGSQQLVCTVTSEVVCSARGP